MLQKSLGLLALILVLALSACGGEQTPAPGEVEAPTQAASQPAVVKPAASPTIDPCAPQYQRVLAERAHSHMREFDDAANLAANLNTEALPAAIAELQRIRRAAEDEPLPGCLAQLKQLQVAHMNVVINTLMGMLSQSSPEDLQKGILAARQLHDEYTLELGRAYGVTFVVEPTATPGAVETVAPALTVTNPGPTGVNLRGTPDLNGTVVGVLAIDASLPVLGKSADGKWVYVEIPEKPGEKAWLYLQPVSLSGPLDAVQVVAP